MITVARVRELLNYDPDTGEFTWRVALSNRAPKGTRAGCKAGKKIGVVIRIDGKLYRAGRLAWLHIHGEWPKHPLAPCNGDIEDLRLSNLVETPLGSLLTPAPKASGQPLTAERLRDLVIYDGATGVFRHRNPVGLRVKAGDVAGSVNDRGYVKVVVDGKSYRAHALAWLYVHGRWPEGRLDHRDLDRSNNRIDNLREATGSQNQANRSKQANNTSGYKGVYWLKSQKKWLAKVVRNGKQYHLGLHDTVEAAHAAYKAGSERLHGEFARSK